VPPRPWSLCRSFRRFSLDSGWPSTPGGLSSGRSRFAPGRGACPRAAGSALRLTRSAGAAPGVPGRSAVCAAGRGGRGPAAGALLPAGASSGGAAGAAGGVAAGRAAYARPAQQRPPSQNMKHHCYAYDIHQARVPFIPTSPQQTGRRAEPEQDKPRACLRWRRRRRHAGEGHAAERGAGPRVGLRHHAAALPGASDLPLRLLLLRLLLRIHLRPGP